MLGRGNSHRISLTSGVRSVSLSPSLLHAVTMLHSGAIIIDEETVFTIAAEAYCRSTAIDIHGETNLKTLVLPSIPIPLAFYTAKDAWRSLLQQRNTSQ